MPNPSRGLRPFAPQRFGRYTLLTPIAKGGMGAVYLARMGGVEGFEKLVVIKKILPDLAQEADFVDRFVDEAKIVVKLHHGAIAQVLDMGKGEDGSYFIAMEFVDGKDLRKVAARFRELKLPIPAGLALYITVRTLDALAYAHRKKDDQERDLNLVHRDVSPQNVLVSYEGEVKITDFGLAKSALTLGRTHPSVILGKFFYMSPEQARHQPVDKRSDLYAAGICLWELLAGRNPFDDVHPGELMRAVANPSIPGVRKFRPDLPESVEQALMKSLCPDPAGRYASAEEMRGKLTAVMLEADPTAGPESLAALMRTHFAREYDAERKAIANLAKLAVPAEPQPEPEPPPRAPAARPAPAPEPEPAPPAIQTEIVKVASLGAPSAVEEPRTPRELAAPPPEDSAAEVDSAPTPRSTPAIEASLAGYGEDGPPTPRGVPEMAPGAAEEPAGEPQGDPDEHAEHAAEEPSEDLDERAHGSSGKSWALVAVGVVCLVAAVVIALVVFKPFSSPTAPKPPPTAVSPVAPLPPKPPASPEPAAATGQGAAGTATGAPAAVADPVPPALPADSPDAAQAAAGPAPEPAPSPGLAAGQAAEPTPAKAEEPAPAATAEPEPDASLPPLKGLTPKPAVPAKAKTDKPKVDSAAQKKRLALERLYADLTRKLNKMKEVYPCDRIGMICTHFWANLDASYKQMLDSPADYGELEKMMLEYATKLEARRKALGLPAD